MSDCGFVPFNNKDFDITFFVFRSTTAFVQKAVDALKSFSIATQKLDCVQSSVFTSIHGNMILWYGIWMKKSSQNKESLNKALLSRLKDVLILTELTDHHFYDPQNGVSEDGSSILRFSTGDIINVNRAEPTSSNGKKDHPLDQYLATLKTHFMRVEGVKASVCMKCQTRSRVGCFRVWHSIDACYSFLLVPEKRRRMKLCLKYYNLGFEYDFLKVVFVSSYDVGLNIRSLELENEVNGRDEAYESVQILEF